MNRPTILLVEDDHNDALFLEFALRKSSLALHLQQVCDGQAAIAYLQGEGRYSNRNAYPLPGLVVLDLHMPGFGGLAVLRWIRQQPRLRGLPVVVLSGSDYGRSLDEAMASGADTYMIKGHDTKGLIHLLENANLSWAEQMPAR